MAKITLSAQVRADLSRHNLKKIRREEKIPAVLYVAGKESTSIQISTHDFVKLAHGEHGRSLESIIIDLEVKDGDKSTTVPTIIKEIQHDFIKGNVLHIDFNEISLTKKIHTHIPVVVVGESIGERHGGIVEHVMRELEIVCLPSDLPEEITVNIEELDINQSIHVRDIDLGPKVEIVNNPDQTIIAVAMPRKEVEEVEEEAAEEEFTEPEVIGEKPELEEEETEKKI